MNLEKFLSAALIALVAFITIGYFWYQEPEGMSVTSGDGIVTVSGVARESQRFAISETEGDISLPFVSKVYRIAPSVVTLDVPVALAFQLPEQVGEYAVYRRDEQRFMWEEVTFGSRVEDEKLIAEVNHLGSFAIGKKLKVDAPAFLAVYDELFALAPKNTVQYETVVGYTLGESQAVIRLAGVQDAAACGDSVRADGVETSRKDRQASVLVNDVETKMTFVFVSTWLTASTGGCSAEMPLRRAADYDILAS